MGETLQFLVNLLHQYLHSFRGEREKFLWANGPHIGSATDISSIPPGNHQQQSTYKSYMMIDRQELRCKVIFFLKLFILLKFPFMQFKDFL